MIMNLKGALNIVFLVSGLLTLLAALSPRHYPHSQMVFLPSQKNGRLEIAMTSPSHIQLYKLLHVCPASPPPFSYSREVFLNPPKANHPSHLSSDPIPCHLL